MRRQSAMAPGMRQGCRSAWLLAILGLLIASCAPPPDSDSAPRTSGRPSYVSARNLEQLVELSTVIAIGRLEGVEGEINLARDADNPSRASDDSYVLGQVYRLRVDRYLKGEGPDTIRVVQAEAWDYGGASRRATSSREAIQRLRQEALDAGYVIPLAPGITYLLFLSPLGLVREDDYYAGTPQPWRFVLTEDGRAYPDSPWEPADEVFPPRPAEELLGEIEQLVEGTPTATPSIHFITAASPEEIEEELRLTPTVPGEIRLRTYMTAEAQGELRVVNGCLYIQAVDAPSRQLLIWPPELYALDEREGTVRILDARSGEELVRVGDRIRMGGGQLMYEHLSDRVRAQLPADCPGPYWAVGLGLERWEPTPTALPAPSPQPSRTPTTQPTVAAERVLVPLTPVPTSAAAPGANLVLLYVHDGDLWRADVRGAHRQRLTLEQPLRTRYRDIWGASSWDHPTYVSPDGRWLAQWVGKPERGGTPEMLLVDVVGGVYGWLPGPISPEAAWSPDGRTLAWSPDPDAPGSPAGVVEIYAYDTERGWVERLFQGDREEWRRLGHLVWSPDGRQIAFGCCYEEVFIDGTYQGRTVGEVHVLDVAGRDVHDTGQPIESYVARSTSLCWTAAGGVTTTREEGVTCSPMALPGEARRSPDGALYASWVPADAEDRAGPGTSRLTVLRWDTREVAWERTLHVTVGALRWSPDGAYLLLDDGEPDTLIWRLSADGAGEPKVVIEAGLVIDVVPQWAAA